MKSLGQAAVDLPWVTPCAGALVALTRASPQAAWAEARLDPGCILALARCAQEATSSFHSATQDPHLLEFCQDLLRQRTACVDWSAPGADAVYHAALRQADLAHRIASHLQNCDPDKAWMGGMAASLSWFALCAAQPDRTAELLDPASADVVWQQRQWGLDITSIARRLARRWNLPSWLGAIAGHLGLPANIAAKLGADPVLFQTVQLAVALVQQKKAPPLPVGGDVRSLQTTLDLTCEEVIDFLESPPPLVTLQWSSPADHPYLDDLLRLALQQRRPLDSTWVERLERDLDQMQQVILDQQAGENERLRKMKLAAVAELAAGAGHEINNPLAVISGQAQYLLKQMNQTEEMLAEDTTAPELLQHLKGKFTESLQKIIGQTQRVHHVLTDLMQFARPATPSPQPVSAAALVREATSGLQKLSLERNTKIDCPPAPEHWAILGDAGQARTALTALVRNAIEAAASAVTVRLEMEAGSLCFLVEDDGPGPDNVGIEHLFDPFYSGRSAGRGRGLGLSTAWRLAQHNGGETRYAGRPHGLTRFVLSLPAAEVVPFTPPAATAPPDDVAVEMA